MTTRMRSGRGRRTCAALAATAMTTALVGGLAQPAGAAGGCERAANAVVCFTVNNAGTRAYDVHLGIDVHMSQAEAQAIIDEHGNDSVVVLIVGLDYGGPESLFFLPTTWVAAGPDGFAAELDLRVLQSQINEDDAWYDRRDEVQAWVGGYATSLIKTREIHAYF